MKKQHNPLSCNTVADGSAQRVAKKGRAVTPEDLLRFQMVYPACTSHGMSRSGPLDLRIHRLRQILDWWQRFLTQSKG